MRSLRRFYLISGTAVVALGILIMFLLRPGPKPKVTLNDGSTLVLERIDYTGFTKRRPSPVIEALRSIVSHLSGQPTFRRYAEPGSMAVWLSVREKETGKFMQPHFTRVVGVDDHGCEFYASDFVLHGPNWSTGSYPAAQPPAGGASNYLLVSALLRSFPTRQTDFSLRVYDAKGDLMADFRVPNTVRPSQVVWKPVGLPATNSLGDLTVILESVTNRLTVVDRYGTMWERFQLIPTAKFLHKGQQTTDWKLQATHLSDATGQRVNADATTLCSKETAWKIDFEYERKPTAEFATNESWTITGLPLPQAGKVVQPGKSNSLDGVTLKLLAVAGPALITYSNGIPISSAISSLTGGGSSVSTGSGMIGGRRSVSVTVDSGKPYVLLLVDNWPEQMRLAMRAKDDTGRETLAPWPNMSAGASDFDFRIFQLDTATNAKTVDISFFVHGSRRFEFLISPPPPPPPEPYDWSEIKRRATAGKIPPRDSTVKPELIDLTSFYTRALSNGYVRASGSIKNSSWSKSYNFSSVPLGNTKLGRIDFDIRGAVQLSGLALLKADERFPKKVTGIPIDRTCKRLHFLHGAIWKVEDESEIGQFVIQFENGTSAARSIRYGIDVRDWDLFNDEPARATEAELIEIPKNRSSSSDVGHLYLTTFENPRPDQPIRTIDFVSRHTAAAPFLIAITVE